MRREASRDPETTLTKKNVLCKACFLSRLLFFFCFFWGEIIILVLVEVHASDGGGVSVEGVDAGAGVGVPDLEGAVRAAAHDRVAFEVGERKGGIIILFLQLKKKK